MRICLYTDTALPKMGGQEMVVDALARQFQALGHEPTVFAPKPRKLSIRGEAYPYEVVRHPRFFSTKLFIAWYQWFLLKQFHRQRFDVLHCHGIYPPTYLAALLGAQLPAPIVVTSHGGDVFADNVRLQKPALVERCVQGLGRADALVAISRFTREGYTRLCPEAAPRIVDIPNGVHVAALTEPAAAPPAGFGEWRPGEYAIFLGRLKYRKGVDVLLHAMARAAEAGNAQLAIVGDGEERPFLEILCDQLGLREHVRFLGKMAGPAKKFLLQNARFGVVPSRQWESFGLVVLEGYAAGLPMIATDLPGLADLILPNQTGLLVPPESPDALAAALVRLFADDELVRRMGQAGRQMVRQYDWRNIACGMWGFMSGYWAWGNGWRREEIMMYFNRWTVGGAVLATLAIAGMVAVGMLPSEPRPSVTKTNFDRIQKGMTRADANIILGGPRHKVLMDAVPKHYGPSMAVEGWWGDDGAIALVQFRGEIVDEKKWIESKETVPEKIRRWLHLPK